MRALFQIFVILCSLVGFGAAKLHFEDRLNGDMVKEHLLRSPLRAETSLRLGQTGAAVALGGLRSLVASIWNLRAFIYFENLDWLKLEESYEIITTLQPQTTHYWDTGAWHLHTNASVFYKENMKLSPFRRSAMRQKYINKGSKFLEEGTRQNPDNWKLHDALARLWSDRHKLPDLPRALKHYEDTLACESLPDYKQAPLKRFSFYVMTRIPDRGKNAYTMGLALFRDTERNHTPNLVSCLFALQNALSIPKNDRIPAPELFPQKKLQLMWLKNYWNHRRMGYPMDGVHLKISELEQELQ